MTEGQLLLHGISPSSGVALSQAKGLTPLETETLRSAQHDQLERNSRRAALVIQLRGYLGKILASLPPL
jgi:hypothetical protein